MVSLINHLKDVPCVVCLFSLNLSCAHLSSFLIRTLAVLSWIRRRQALSAFFRGSERDARRQALYVVRHGRPQDGAREGGCSFPSSPPGSDLKALKCLGFAEAG